MNRLRSHIPRSARGIFEVWTTKKDNRSASTRQTTRVAGRLAASSRQQPRPFLGCSGEAKRSSEKSNPPRSRVSCVREPT